MLAWVFPAHFPCEWRFWMPAFYRQAAGTIMVGSCSKCTSIRVNREEVKPLLFTLDNLGKSIHKAYNQVAWTIIHSLAIGELVLGVSARKYDALMQHSYEPEWNRNQCDIHCDKHSSVLWNHNYFKCSRNQARKPNRPGVHDIHTYLYFPRHASAGPKISSQTMLLYHAMATVLLACIQATSLFL